MSILKKLNEEIELWDKCEGAGAVFWMYGWGKKKQEPEKVEIKNEDEDDDYRNDTQGNRNAKYLNKARFYADTAKARLKRQRTEFKKDMHGES